MSPRPTISPEALAEGLRRAARSPEGLWINVSGRSMGRRIGPGRVRVAAARAPARGEVWAYCEENDGVVVHRCVRPAAEGWVFRGDRGRRADQPVPAPHLVGRVVEVDDERGRRSLEPTDAVIARAAQATRRAVGGALRWLRRHH